MDGRPFNYELRKIVSGFRWVKLFEGTRRESCRRSGSFVRPGESLFFHADPRRMITQAGKLSRLKWYHQPRESVETTPSWSVSILILFWPFFSSCRFISSTCEMCVSWLENYKWNPCRVYLRTPMWSLTYKSARSCRVSIYLESICPEGFTSSL